MGKREKGKGKRDGYGKYWIWIMRGLLIIFVGRLIVGSRIGRRFAGKGTVGIGVDKVMIDRAIAGRGWLEGRLGKETRRLSQALDSDNLAVVVLHKWLHKLPWDQWAPNCH